MKSFADEIAHEMMVKTAENKTAGLIRLAFDNLDYAASIFENEGMYEEAELITKALEKLSK